MGGVVFLVFWGIYMAKVKIDIERCKGCGLCVLQCPHGCLRMSETTNMGGNIYAVIDGDADKCTGCALCCQMCADMAMEISDSSEKKTQVKT